MECMRKRLKNYTAREAGEKRAEELMEKYGSMSEDALYSKLMQEVASAKSNGTFSATRLAADIDRMRPYLTHEQVEKLNHLLRIIGS